MFGPCDFIFVSVEFGVCVVHFPFDLRSFCCDDVRGWLFPPKQPVNCVLRVVCLVNKKIANLSVLMLY